MTQAPPADLVHRLKLHGQDHVLGGWDDLMLSDRLTLVGQLAGRRGAQQRALERVSLDRGERREILGTDLCEDVGQAAEGEGPLGFGRRRAQEPYPIRTSPIERGAHEGRLADARLNVDQEAGEAMGRPFQEAPPPGAPLPAR